MAATGWMAGPYLSMKLGSGVVFDGRAAWGETENAHLRTRKRCRPDRAAARARQAHRHAPGRGLEGRAERRVRLSARMPCATREPARCKAAGTGKVEVLPEVSRRFELGGDTFVEPRAAVGGYLGFDDFSALNPTITTDRHGDLAFEGRGRRRCRCEGRLDLESDGRRGERRQQSTPENWSGRLQLNVPLGKMTRMLQRIQFCQHCLYGYVTESYYACRISHL